jgi:signal transduction histidine kinase
LFSHLTWSQRFLLVSLVAIVSGMFGMGWWVGEQIETQVVHQTAAYTALYVASVVEPSLQDLEAGQVSPDTQAMLISLLQDTSLGQHITAVNVWDVTGRVVFSTHPANIGRVFPVEGELRRALRGWVAAHVAVLDEPEHASLPDFGQRRLETYSPLRRAGSTEIIGAVEFYQTVDDLDQNIALAQQRSWLSVAAVTGLIYLVLAGFVRYASNTIRRQQTALTSQVGQLQLLLYQNQLLSDRVRRAARRSTSLNERFLRRISAELHDGPAQDLGLALLRLDHLRPNGAPPVEDFEVVQGSLQHALQEIRAISAGLGVPALENTSLAEVATRAVRVHERRTRTSVALRLVGDLPDPAPLPVAITVFRLLQEGLNNAYRHAGGAGQAVTITCEAGQVVVEIADAGPGFDAAAATAAGDEHLGLAGMRERVESLGGTFRIDTAPGAGARLVARLPLEAVQVTE